jgi:hypothetical protein
MRTLTTYQLWHGVDSPPATLLELRAGPVTAQLDGIDLRYVRLGSLELVRRIYVGVRDQNWNTIPGTFQIISLERQTERFEIVFEAEHRSADLDFAWRGRISGTPDGQIRYAMDGVARSDFRYNRIGFCVLHPFRECAGQAYTAWTPEGEISGHLPELIGPQRFEQGHYVPLFPSFSRLRVALAEGIAVRFDFAGDLFEMEDQRNWTDASFKTYCTPLARGFPHQAHAGMALAQEVTLTPEGDLQRAPAAASAEPRLTLGGSMGRGLPAIGFSLGSAATRPGILTAQEIARLRRLSPAHLRVDLHLAQEEPQSLEPALQLVEALQSALELALFLTPEMTEPLQRLAAFLRGRAAVARFLIFQEGAQTAHPSETTAPALIELARSQLAAVAPGAAFVGGTDMYFCELNRTRPQVEAMDGIAYSVIPQAHAFDDLSLVETLEAQAETVRSAQAFAGAKPISVTPITLKRRYNPHATTAERERAPDELPESVDPRQMSLLGAAWTAGSIKYLAESGAASLTYYETVGWLGLMQGAEGPPLPDQFPAAPGMVFPLYHVFADLAEWQEPLEEGNERGTTLVACQSDQPLQVAGLAVARAGILHLLVMNFSATPQRVHIGPLPAGSGGAQREVRLRRLDATSAPEALFAAERFRQRWDQVVLQHGELLLELAPYAVVRLAV